MADEGMSSQTLVQVWPVLKQVMQRFSGNPYTIEEAGRAIKTLLQGSQHGSESVLPEILETLAQQFAATRHSCMLYLASEVLKTYGTDPKYRDILGEAACCFVCRAPACFLTLCWQCTT